jgi:hypothetical protein
MHESGRAQGVIRPFGEHLAMRHGTEPIVQERHQAVEGLAASSAQVPQKFRLALL